MASRKGRSIPTPKTRISDAQIAVRVPGDLLALLDEQVERLRAERPGLAITRSDAVREILYVHLRAAEGKRPA